MPDCPELRLWVLEENHRARRFYEKRGWRLNGETRVVPYPPNPLDVGYTYVRRSRERRRRFRRSSCSTPRCPSSGAA